MEGVNQQANNVARFLGNGVNLRIAARTEAELEAVGLTTPKTERDDLRQNDPKVYDKLRTQVEAGLSSKFRLLKPIDGNSSSEHFEAIYTVVT